MVFTALQKINKEIVENEGSFLLLRIKETKLIIA